MRISRPVLLASLGVLAIAGCGRDAATPVSAGPLLSTSDSTWTPDPADSTIWRSDCPILESGEASDPTFCPDTTTTTTTDTTATPPPSPTPTPIEPQDSVIAGYGCPATGGLEYGCFEYEP